MIKVSGKIWQSIPWKLRSALRSMLSVFKGRILYQRILGLLYFNLSFDENGRKTREIINRNCALVLRTREQNSNDPPEVTLHRWSPEMSALLLATLMDCPEGCKDAWDCCRLSNIECYVRCGQSVDRAWIFLSVTTRCMWQLVDQCTTRYMTRSACHSITRIIRKHPCFVLDTRSSFIVDIS